MIYNRKCGYSKCGESFQSVAVSAKYCCPSHRTLAWNENNIEPYKPHPEMNQSEMRDFLKAEKEREKNEAEITALRIKNPELQKQIDDDKVYIEKLKKEILLLKDDVTLYKDLVVDEHKRWRDNPEKQANRKIAYYKHLLQKPDPEPKPEPEPEFVEYRRKKLFGFLFNSWDEPYAEILKLNPKDVIRTRQVIKDGFILFNKRKI